MSTLLSTPGRQVTKGGSYLDIGMGRHFERCGGVKAAFDKGDQQIQLKKCCLHLSLVLTAS